MIDWGFTVACTAGALESICCSSHGSCGLLPGMLLTMENPKAVIFFGVVLPHAFDMSALSYAQMGLILGLGFTIDLGIQLAYLFAATRVRKLVQSELHMKRVNRSSAGLMTGVAALIASRG